MTTTSPSKITARASRPWNDDELKVLATLRRARGGALTIREIGERSRVRAPSTAFDPASPTRNALRRLVHAGLVEQVGRGTYRFVGTGPRA